MSDIKRQKTAVIDETKLRNILNGQIGLSRSMLNVADSSPGKRIEYKSPDLTGCYIAGQLDGQGYKVEGVIGVPGAFGVCWTCKRVSKQNLKSAVQGVLQTSKSLISDAIQKVIKACKRTPEQVQLIHDVIANFKADLANWKTEICSKNAENEAIAKACEQICEVCHIYVNRAGYSSTTELCHPSAQKLKRGMEAILAMVNNNDMFIKVCVKTYYIPNKKEIEGEEKEYRYVRRVQRELENIKEIVDQKLAHDNMATIYDVLLDADVFQTENSSKKLGKTICVVQELVEGGIDLWEWVTDFRRRFHENFLARSALHHRGVSQYFFRQLMEAIAFLHVRKIFHYDIKIENVMISSSSKALKLIDFGLGKVIGGEDSDAAADTRAHTMECPSVGYLAPEVQGASFTVPYAADIWGCGLVLLALTVPKDLSKEFKQERGKEVKKECEKVPAKSFSDLLSRSTPDSRLAERLDGKVHEDAPALQDLLTRSFPSGSPLCFDHSTVATVGNSQIF